MGNSNTYRLDDRALLRVAGAEVFAFLQNLLTCDMAAVEGGAVYGCLLTPQGQVLHDLFVSKDGGGYLLDCAAAGRGELARRLATYKLRAKVEIAPEDSLGVYAAGGGDARLAELPGRVYTAEELAGALPVSAYDDACIVRGVPPFAAMRVGKDYISDLNLDLLNAVSFTKGCYVGQELTARMHHRALVKKRLLLVEGTGLAVGDKVVRGGVELGEIRAVSSARTEGLGVFRLDALKPDAGALEIPEKTPVRIHKADYMITEELNAGP